MVGDPTVLRHRLIRLLIPHVEIAERVHGRPVLRFRLDDLDVFFDRTVELPLAEQLLDFSRRLFALGSHLALSLIVYIVSNKHDGRNERRCTAE